MKVVIFGANGKTGKLVVEQALAKGYSVVAYVRRKGAISIQHENLIEVVGDLNTTEKLTEAISGADACISTLGGASLTRHSTEISAGVKNIVKIMETVGVNRFIYLSSMGTGESRFYMSPLIRFFIVNVLLRVPLADHNFNEQNISSGKLDWTIVRPGGLTDGELTTVKHGSEKILIKENNSISRITVASFLVEQLNDKQYYKKAVWLMATN